MALLNTALPAVDIGSSQAQRLVQHYGNSAAVEDLLASPGFKLDSSNEQKIAVEEKDTARPILYVQVDGAHLLTEEGYQETKVGRIFGGQHIVQKDSGYEDVIPRNALAESDYLAHLGYYKDFTKRFDLLIEAHLAQSPKAQMVVVSDGAPWIANWLKEHFPQARLILDFYHAVEHLTAWAKLAFEDAKLRNPWVEARKTALWNGQIPQVLRAIVQQMCGKKGLVWKKGQALLAYYRKNFYRMKYNEYRALGYCIGSGAIESAISTVVQQRCKLVGQRWTQRVAAVLNLRAIFKSSKRDKLRAILCQNLSPAKVA